MKVLRVQVTQADIDEGVVGDCKLCPMAVALNRQYPEQAWSVGTTWVCHVDGSLMCRNSDPSRQFITQFDRGELVRPATFVLKLGMYP